MLSQRGSKSAQSQDIPWRFAPGGDNRYDKTTNPTGVIPLGTAENVNKQPVVRSRCGLVLTLQEFDAGRAAPVHC